MKLMPRAQCRRRRRFSPNPGGYEKNRGELGSSTWSAHSCRQITVSVRSGVFYAGRRLSSEKSRVESLDRVTAVNSKGTPLYKLVLSAVPMLCERMEMPRIAMAGSPRSPDDGCLAKLKDTSWSRWPLHSSSAGRPAGPAGTAAGWFH
jgi:hypothetical protein